MLYTIGFKEGYDARLEDDGPDPIKMGKRPEKNYPGGCVFYSEQSARNNCPREFDVYGLMATEEDVETNPQEEWDNLVNDALIVQLPKCT
jgi:hypothetical protein